MAARYRSDYLVPGGGEALFHADALATGKRLHPEINPHPNHAKNAAPLSVNFTYVPLSCRPQPTQRNGPLDPGAELIDASTGRQKRPINALDIGAASCTASKELAISRGRVGIEGGRSDEGGGRS
jgi:hypothetical protein